MADAPMPGEFTTYLSYVIGIVRPGRPRPVFPVHTNEPGSLDKWSTEDLGLVIDEGRRQLDAQSGMLGDLRSRAQWLVTIAIPVIVAIASTQPTIWTGGYVVKLLWVAAITLIAYGLLGSVAIMTVRVDFGSIDTAKLSTFETDQKRGLASAFSRSVRTGANTNATLVTLFRQSVFWFVIGGACGLVAWITAR